MPDFTAYCNGSTRKPAMPPTRPGQNPAVAAKRTPDLAQRLSTMIDAYKTKFHQQSVGLVTRDSCAAF